MNNISFLLMGLALFWVALDPPPALAAQPQGTGLKQRLNEPVSGELSFTNSDGTTLKLGEISQGKPLLVAPVYFECPNLCDSTLRSLIASLRDVTYTVGKDFEVAFVSISPEEGPKVAGRKKAEAVRLYDRPGSAHGWHFLTGTQKAIDQLTRELGFRYTYDPETKEYHHPSAIMIITPGLRLSRYLLGLEFQPRDVALSLVEASKSRIGTTTDRFLLYCYTYNPEVGAYGLTVKNTLRISGLVTALGLFGLIGFLLRSERKIPQDGDPHGPGGG